LASVREKWIDLRQTSNTKTTRCTHNVHTLVMTVSCYMLWRVRNCRRYYYYYYRRIRRPGGPAQVTHHHLISFVRECYDSISC